MTTCEHACLYVFFIFTCESLHVCIYVCIGMDREQEAKIPSMVPIVSPNLKAILEKCINAHGSKGGTSNSISSPFLLHFLQLSNSQQ